MVDTTMLTTRHARSGKVSEQPSPTSALASSRSPRVSGSSGSAAQTATLDPVAAARCQRGSSQCRRPERWRCHRRTPLDVHPRPRRHRSAAGAIWCSARPVAARPYRAPRLPSSHCSHPPARQGAEDHVLTGRGAAHALQLIVVLGLSSSPGRNAPAHPARRSGCAAPAHGALKRVCVVLIAVVTGFVTRLALRNSAADRRWIPSSASPPARCSARSGRAAIRRRRRGSPRPPSQASTRPTATPSSTIRAHEPVSPHGCAERLCRRSALAACPRLSCCRRRRQTRNRLADHLAGAHRHCRGVRRHRTRRGRRQAAALRRCFIEDVFAIVAPVRPHSGSDARRCGRCPACVQIASDHCCTCSSTRYVHSAHSSAPSNRPPRAR